MTTVGGLNPEVTNETAVWPRSGHYSTTYVTPAVRTTGAMWTAVCDWLAGKDRC